MKKNFVKIIIFVLVFMIIISIAILAHYKANKREQISVNDITILVNRDASDINEPPKTQAKIYNVDFEKDTYNWESPGKKQAEIILSLKMANGEICIVENENGRITSSIVTDSGVTKKHCYLDWSPELILEYGEDILFKQGTNLFAWRYNDDNVIKMSNISNEYNGGKIYSCKNSLVFAEDDKWIIYRNKDRKAIKNNADCLGFLDENTLVFAKEEPFIFEYIYKYDINTGKKYDRRIRKNPGFMVYEVAFSPDGKYMLYFSGNGEGGIETYILEMKSYVKNRIDLGVEDIISIQWLNYS